MNFALVVAAGSGSRMKLEGLPKQFLKVNDVPVLVYSLKTFASHKDISGIVIVANPAYIPLVVQFVEEYHIEKVLAVVSGGETRQESVFHGLETFKEFRIKDDDIVLIHDAARPLVNENIITSNIKECQKHEAVTTALSVNDTIAVTNENKEIIDVPNRETLFAIQTPQTFKYSLILKAHENYNAHPFKYVTDDTSLVKKLNHPVYIVEGNKENLKITTQEDLSIVEQFLKK